VWVAELIFGHAVTAPGDVTGMVDGGCVGVSGLDLSSMFGAALGLALPWQVIVVDFDQDAGRLELTLDFTRGARFPCPEEGCVEAGCSVHDPVDKTWRHLDFFEHQAFLHARVPRVRCGAHGVHLVKVPWARPDSGFTLLFEVAMLTYAKQMPIAPLAKMAREHDTRIWRVIEHHVNRARAGMDFSDVTDIGMDETSARRGQDYVSIFMDLTERRVMFATEGREASTVQAFAADLKAHGGAPTTRIERVCCDMSDVALPLPPAHARVPPNLVRAHQGRVRGAGRRRTRSARSRPACRLLQAQPLRGRNADRALALRGGHRRQGTTREVGDDEAKSRGGTGWRRRVTRLVRRAVSLVAHVRGRPGAARALVASWDRPISSSFRIGDGGERPRVRYNRCCCWRSQNGGATRHAV
jgi:hypothetical protein